MERRGVGKADCDARTRAQCKASRRDQRAQLGESGEGSRDPPLEGLKWGLGRFAGGLQPPTGSPLTRRIPG